MDLEHKKKNTRPGYVAIHSGPQKLLYFFCFIDIQRDLIRLSYGQPEVKTNNLNYYRYVTHVIVIGIGSVGDSTKLLLSHLNYWSRETPDSNPALPGACYQSAASLHCLNFFYKFKQWILVDGVDKSYISLNISMIYFCPSTAPNEYLLNF